MMIPRLATTAATCSLLLLHALGSSAQAAGNWFTDPIPLGQPSRPRPTPLPRPRIYYDLAPGSPGSLVLAGGILLGVGLASNVVGTCLMTIPPQDRSSEYSGLGQFLAGVGLLPAGVLFLVVPGAIMLGVGRKRLHPLR